MSALLCVSCDVSRILQNHRLEVEACSVMFFCFPLIAFRNNLPRIVVIACGFGRPDNKNCHPSHDGIPPGTCKSSAFCMASLHACVCLFLLPENLGLSLWRSGSSITSATLKQLKPGLGLSLREWNGYDKGHASASNFD